MTWAAMWAPSINRFVKFSYVHQFAAQRALAAFSFICHRRFIRHRRAAAVGVARISASRSAADWLPAHAAEYSSFSGV